MGMFDEIRCEYPIPDAEVQDALFQTKDFDCQLHLYTITKEGRLIHHDGHLELVSEEERPYYGKPEWEKPLFKLAGSMRFVPDGDVDTNYHGDVIFYTSAGKRPNYEWYEYQARFTEGQLQWIKRVNEDLASV